MIAIHENTLNPMLDKIGGVLKDYDLPEEAKGVLCGVLDEFNGLVKKAEEETATYQPWIAKAEEKYANHTDDIEIDSENTAVPLSIADDGVWVMAWLWVGNPEADPCPHCKGTRCEVCHDTGDASQIDEDDAEDSEAEGDA